MRPNNNKKKESKYIERNIQKSGANFMMLKSPIDVMKDAPNIIKELVFGNIDLDKWGSIFILNHYIQGLKQYTTEQYNLLASLDKIYTFANMYGQLSQSEFEFHTKIIKPKMMVYYNIYATMCNIEMQRSYTPIYKLQQDLSTPYTRELFKNDIRI